MKKLVIGYIFCNRNPGADEKAFLKIAKKKKINLIMFNLCKEYDEGEIEEKARKCNVIFNNSAEEFSQEVIKTLEELGKKVVDSSKVYYYVEDKWMFYMKCKNHDIPVPETILLSENINLAKKELVEFNHWPVILKRIEGSCGEYVEKADNINQAERIIKKFWKKGSEKTPIIGQEFIHSFSYRIMTIGNKIVQTAVKESNNWKCTGVYEKKFKKFKVDNELRKIIKNLIKIIDIKVCGIDLIKKNNQWIVLEVNAVPALDFFPEEREKLAEKILNLLVKEIKR